MDETTEYKGDFEGSDEALIRALRNDIQKYRSRIKELEERNRVLEGLLDEMENDPDIPIHYQATIDQVRTIQKDGRVISSTLSENEHYREVLKRIADAPNLITVGGEEWKETALLMARAARKVIERI